MFAHDYLDAASRHVIRTTSRMTLQTCAQTCHRAWGRKPLGLPQRMLDEKARRRTATDGKNKAEKGHIGEVCHPRRNAA